MAFDPDYLEELKNRVRPSDLIGRTVALKRRGNEFVGLSPFNKEKTPSFCVIDDKRMYHCFSSGKSGDVITWVMETEGLSFTEAVRRLAEEAGLPPPEPPTPEAKRRAQVRTSLRGWLEEAHTFFQKALHARGGAEARAYLIEKRGIPHTDWARYEIGYAPDGWRALREHLLKAGARERDLVEAGLVTQKSGGDGYDTFRNRIMFTIRDPERRIVGFGGRALDPNDRAKYLNTRDTSLFDKGRLLYRFPEARAAVAQARGDDRPQGPIVVEGYLDAIALARVGMAHAVAPLGTALTEDQLALLWRVGPEPILCFDGDAAGRRAAGRAIERALPHVGAGKSLRLVTLPPGQDPDDIARAGGAAAVETAFAAAVPLIEAVWREEESAAPLDTPERRADLRKRLFAAAARIEDKATSEQYRAELLDRFDDQYGWRARRRARDAAFGGGFGARGGAAAMPGPEVRARDTDRDLMALKAGRLLRALLDRPALIAWNVERLSALSLPTEPLDGLRDALVDAATCDPGIDKDGLDVHLARLGVLELAARVRGDRGLAAAIIGHTATDDADAAAAWAVEAEAYIRDTGRKDTDAERRDAARVSVASGDKRRLAAAARRPDDDEAAASMGAGEDLAEDVDTMRQRMNDRVASALANKRRRRS